MSEEKKYIGESKILGNPTKPISLKLGEKVVKTKHIDDGAIETEQIANEAVTPDKLSRSVQNLVVQPAVRQVDQKYQNITNELYSMVESLQVSGIALSNQFGDREDIGITQKSLTKAIGRIWEEISNITGIEYMDFTFTVDPQTVYSEEATTILITADATSSISDFDSIKIYADDELIAESSDINLFTVTHVVNESVRITAEGVILGKTIIKTADMVKDTPFFLGAGNVYTDVINETCRRVMHETLEGNYDVTVNNDGEHIYIVVPISKKDEFRRADMNGFEVPVTTTILEEYVVYESVNTYNAGTYNIDIDINSI